MCGINLKSGTLHNINELPKSLEVHLGNQGRLVIPVALRRALGFKAGDALIIRQEKGCLVLEKPETIKLRLKSRFSHLPPNRSLASELIAERREEVRRENAD